MPRTITIDAGLETDLAAFRKAREARRAAVGRDLPAATIQAAYDREHAAALDLACAVASRTEGA